MFVLMNVDTKALWCLPGTRGVYKTLGWARRAAAKYSEPRWDCKYVPIHYDAYMELYGKRTRKVFNLMSGQEVEIDINTPACCDPSTELYWSM